MAIANTKEKPKGKEPYKYFRSSSNRRVELFLKQWTRYHPDGFESNDNAYSLHKTVDDLFKFENSLLKKKQWTNPTMAPYCQLVYVPKKTAEKLKRDSKYKSGGILITTSLN
jgi:hypothetical protein